DMLSLVAPAGPVYQAGTFSGNPLAMTAGIATLRALQEPGVWEQIERAAASLTAGLAEAAAAAGVPIYQTRVGTMFTTFFSDRPVTDWPTAARCDTRRYAAFFRAMLANGVYLAPSQFEAGFLSTAHGPAEIELTLAAARPAFRAAAG
ncbi:MAG: aminotransferase class III-fold pyridoxal phosphate-dependent enzyme, partial [Candidatus Promineifilaceae bacterium]